MRERKEVNGSEVKIVNEERRGNVGKHPVYTVGTT
jgi:hypothetical protein